MRWFSRPKWVMRLYQEGMRLGSGTNLNLWTRGGGDTLMTERVRDRRNLLVGGKKGRN